ncbi:MAG: hypothetical protein LBU22_12800 [Dysgonamonadaceae bacterium]|jgi:hypothetical protein|nr:hypothetical protein [Dysgonamonadaceae bacterium]
MKTSNLKNRKVALKGAIMKGLNVMFVLLFAGYVMMACSGKGSGTASVETTNETETTAFSDVVSGKPIKIKYLDGNKPIPDTVIHLIYYDQGKSAWTDVSASSDNEGFVSFTIPLTAEGASYSFFCAFSPEDKDEKMELATKDQLRLFRIPDDTDQLELWAYKDGGMSNQVGSIQMWGKE